MHKFKIELISDLCSSSGENYGATIDSDVCYDKYGFPYIQAKRIKGCLREVALELMDWEDTIHIDEIFGKSGDENGGKESIIIKDALLENYENIAKMVQNSEYKMYLHPQNILENYTYVRVQTAVDADGIAEENSLRYTRVVKKGVVFECEFELNDKYIEEFKKCIKGFKRTGLNRNRGIGYIKCEYVPVVKNNTFAKPDYKFDDNNEYELKYFIELESTMMFPKAEGGATNTETFIPGSSIMGYFASQYSKNKHDDFKELFLDGNLFFQNAYISDGKNRYLPVSSSIVKKKDAGIEENCFNKLNDIQYDENSPIIQTKAVGDKYIFVEDENFAEAKMLSVDTEVCYHHKRSEDKAVGMAEGKNFYQYSSISKGQVFAGIIRGNGKYLKKVLELFPNDGVITLGRSKTAQYGRGRIINIKKVKVPSKKANSKEFVIELRSPTILLNEFGVVSTDVKELKKAVEDKVPVIINKTFLRYKTVGGYNVKWNLPKPQTLAFDAGTVCVFQTTIDADISKLNHVNIGERVSEGFGEISAYPYDKLKSEIMLNLYKKENSSKQDLSHSNWCKTQCI